MLTPTSSTPSRLLSVDPSRTLSLRRKSGVRAAVPFRELARLLAEYLPSLPPMPNSDLMDSLENWLEDQGRWVLPRVEAAMREATREGWERGAARALTDSRFTRKGGTVFALNASAVDQGVLAAVRAKISVRERVKGLFGWARRVARKSWEDAKQVVQRVAGEVLGRGLGVGAVISTARGKVLGQGKRAADAAKGAVIKGHAEGQLDVYETIGVKTIVRLVELRTARDGKVCPTCRNLRGARLTPEKARGVIPIHPNCRCIWVPVEFEEVEERVLVRMPGPTSTPASSSTLTQTALPAIPTPPSTNSSPDPLVMFSRFLKGIS